MTTARQFILVVIVSLLVAVALLSPWREERAAMLAGEGRHKAAIALLERRLASSPHDPDLLAALGRSHAALGDIPQAIDAFDAYLTVRPHDLAAREREARAPSSDRIDRSLSRRHEKRGRGAAIPRPCYAARSNFTDCTVASRTRSALSRSMPARDFWTFAQLDRLGALLAATGGLARSSAMAGIGGPERAGRRQCRKASVA